MNVVQYYTGTRVYYVCVHRITSHITLTVLIAMTSTTDDVSSTRHSYDLHVLFSLRCTVLQHLLQYIDV